MNEVCGQHGKRLYKTEEDAIHAALVSSRVFGKSFRIYGCVQEKEPPYHTTSLPVKVSDGV